MKKIILIIIITCLMIPGMLFSQQRGPGNPGGEPTGNDPPIGGGAPVGSGMVILLSLGAAYLGRKVYVNHKKDQEEIW